MSQSNSKKGARNPSRIPGAPRHHALFVSAYKPVGLLYRPLDSVKDILITGAPAQVSGDEPAQLFPCIPFS